MTRTASPRYVLPSLSLLSAPVAARTDRSAETEATAQAIEKAFDSYKLAVRVVATHRGPTVTQYEISLLDPSVRVSKLSGFQRDLCMHLGVSGVRIIAPLPNKGTVGIEVPNASKDPVGFADLASGVESLSMALPVMLGKDAVGGSLIVDLAKLPHLLVAGATGTGKSVCLNAIISSLLLFKTPEEVRFVMVDPKFVELAGYEGIPHMLAPPITDMGKTEHVLEWACKTMDNRYGMLRKAGARDIAAYNAKRNDRMPYIVLIIDEYADMMATCDEAESYIVRLAGKARACGIHLILTTQRPSADVVTGLIKANLPARISFRVADKVNSRIVLDANGAETLLGKGDMLFLAPGTSEPVRAQGVYVSDADIAAIVKHAKSCGAPDYDDALMTDSVDDGQSDAANTVEWKYNQLFHAAVQAVIKHTKADVGVIQRHVGVDSDRAEAYLNEMERIGITVMSHGKRLILKDARAWLTMLVEAGVTWAAAHPYYKF